MLACNALPGAGGGSPAVISTDGSSKCAHGVWRQTLQLVREA